MKEKAFVLAFLFCAAGLAAAQDSIAASEIALPSTISKVIVYSDRAIVSRTLAADLAAGENRIVFDDLPERTEANSLQVKGSGKAVLQDTIFRTKYFAEFPDDRIQSLLGSKQDKESQVQLRSDRINRANGEKGVLEKIIAKVTSQVEGQAPELSPDKWLLVLKLYRDRLAGLDEEIRGAEKDIRGLNLELGKVNQELGQVQSGRQKKKNQAVVILSLPEASKVSLTLSYAVYGPSWQPTYDLRVSSETKSLELSYNANVIQNTGEDWLNTSLSLSTARPEIGGAQPDLAPWYLSVYENRLASRGSAAAKPAPAAPAAVNQMFSSGADDKQALESMAEADIAATAATVTNGAVAVMFNISGRASIASDNTNHRVSVMTKSFSAVFRYSTAPKLSAYAYLKAKVVNETDFPFLPGVTKVFLDGNFIANSSMGLVAPAQEFWTFLGVDEGVKVEYKLLKMYKDDQGVFAQRTRYVYQYETKITNNKKLDAEIVVWDQLPVSTDQKIVVKLIEPKYTKDTDNLKKDKQDIFEWLLVLKPQESRTIGLSYSVEYPNGTIVSGL
jgi:uncharacterized protein (TIGR02231 family)